MVRFFNLCCFNSNLCSQHMTMVFKVRMPRQCFTKQMRGVAAFCTGTVEVVVQGITLHWVCTVVADRTRTLTWSKAAQVSKALCCDQHVYIMLSMVNVRGK